MMLSFAVLVFVFLFLLVSVVAVAVVFAFAVSFAFVSVLVVVAGFDKKYRNFHKIQEAKNSGKCSRMIEKYGFKALPSLPRFPHVSS